MTKQRLTIGKDGFSLPHEALVSKAAIVGMSGSGKTQTARRLAESIMDAGGQIIVLAPMAGWWGLRSSADGLSPGFPIVVFGGDHGDAPLRADSGAPMAAAVIEHGFNAIFDLVHFEEEECRQFAADFLRVLNRRNREPVCVFMDEFDILCPQEKKAGSEESRAVVNTTVRRGRIHGIGSVMITQNPQDADKSVLSQADVVIAMRLGGAQAIEAVKKWVGKSRSKEQVAEMVGSLPGLPTGVGWISAAELGVYEKVQIGLCRTFDSSRTPKPGERVAPPKVLVQVDILALGKQMDEQVKKERENSAEWLKSEVERLQRLVDATVEAEEVRLTAEIAILREELETRRTRDTELMSVLLQMRNSSAAAVNMLSKASVYIPEAEAPFAGSWRSSQEASLEQVCEPMERIPQPVEKPVPQFFNPKPGLPAPEEVDSRLGTPERKVLNALVSLRQVGILSPRRLQVALFGGYSSVKSGGFARPAAALISLGLVEGTNGTMSLTDAGVEVAGGDIKPATTRELHGHLRSLLGSPEWKLLEVLIHHYPDAMTRDELAAQTGYTSVKSGGFARPIAKLIELDLAENAGIGKVKGTKMLFVGGKR